MKRILALLLALLLLTGCSTSATEENTITTSAQTVTEAEVSTVPETESPTEVSAEQPTETPTEAETEAPTEAPTEPENKECVHNYKSETVKPTCTSAGYTKKTCTKCGYSFKTDAVKATGHDYTSKVTLEPTCTNKGTKTFTCKNCSHSYNEDIAKVAHNYKSTVVAPTCTTKGYTQHKCKVCGDTYKDSEKAALGHDWNNGKVTKKATCSAEGVKTYTCERNGCGKTKTEAIAKTAHDYKSTVVAPTCTAKGYTLHECKNCDASYKDSETAALGHDWDNGKVTKAATCTEDGVKTYTCERSGCGKTKTEAIKATGHDYKDTVIAPTCTANGYTLHECKNCPASVKDSKTNALGHKWGNWVVTKEPTTTAEGVETRTCSRSGCGATETRPIDKLVEEHKHSYTSKVTKAATCTEDGVKTFSCSCGSTYTEAIAKTGHSYTDKVTAPTCTAKGYTTHTCGNCGHSYKDTETAALGHSWGDWVRTKEPTTEAEGQDTRTCSNCGATETRAVEKLPEETEPDEPTAEDYLADSHYSDEAITYINEYRAANGLPALRVDHSDFVLLRAAELRVSFSHTRPNGGYIYEDGWASECIAGGYSSAKSVVDAWYNSTGGHKETMLNASYTVACVAYNGSYWVLLVA